MSSGNRRVRTFEEVLQLATERRKLLSVAVGLSASAGVGHMAAAQGTPETNEEPQRQGPAEPTNSGPAIPEELTADPTNWPTAQGNLKSTRAAVDSTIDSSTLPEIGIAWRYAIDAAGQWGGITANPIVLGDRVYIQDAECNVRAIDKETGDELWRTDFEEVIGGPNGIGLGYRVMVVSLGDSGDAAGLDAETGELLWRAPLTNNPGETVEVAPVIYDNLAYVSTNPTGSGEGQYRGGQKGILYALDVLTGETVWQWDTTANNLFGMARINSGGGVWYPISVDDEGNLYFGTGNAGPWPGTPDYPNASSRADGDLYASSMVSLDSETGEVRWHIQAKPVDLFDLDFQNSPVLANLTIDGADTLVAIGSGKTGTVIAADANTGEELWRANVGIHQNDDVQEIPEGETLEVYPGTLGSVLTPIAYSEGLVIVPIMNAAGYYTSTGTGEGEGGLATATGQVIALNATTGEEVWSIELPSPSIAGATIANDVVVVGALDGIVRGLNTADGSIVWQYQTGAGLNAPFAISGDCLFVGAGGPLLPSSETADPIPDTGLELIAFKVGAPQDASPAASPVS